MVAWVFRIETFIVFFEYYIVGRCIECIISWLVRVCLCALLHVCLGQAVPGRPLGVHTMRASRRGHDDDVIHPPCSRRSLSVDRTRVTEIVKGGRLEGNLGPTGDVDFQLLREGKFGAKGKMPGEGGASRGGGLRT